MINVQAIFDKYKGKPVEVSDPSNAFQCMDWAFQFCDELGIPRETIRHLYAFQSWTIPNDLTLQYFDYIPNTPNGIPVLGDVLVFSTGVGPAGHIAVVQKADINNVTSMDQNWNGHSYCEYIQHPYDNILGWLRPYVLHPVVAPDCSVERKEADTNWNMSIQVFSALGIDLNPLDKQGSVDRALVKIKDLQDHYTASQPIPTPPPVEPGPVPPESPPVPAPMPGTDYKPYLNRMKVGFYGNSVGIGKWKTPWWASHLVDPRIREVKKIIAESGV